ncbi:MAG: thiamine phosphate synthase [Myxococcales bacterium]|nr:thiamine phosphate synthase [Myxococcales bacterium]
MLHGFYAILDLSPHLVLGGASAIERAARNLLAAKPCVLQLRAKSATAAEMLAVAEQVAPLCQEAEVPFCVNDRLDVAMAVGADAVHLGQDDLPLGAARAVLKRQGFPMRIGVSTHDRAQARRAASEGADYIGFGPVFPTQSKLNPDPVVGLEALRAVVQEVTVPVVAIGGITLASLTSVVASGAAAAAVISAVSAHSDPRWAGQQVQAAFGVQPKRPVM